MNIIFITNGNCWKSNYPFMYMTQKALSHLWFRVIFHEEKAPYNTFIFENIINYRNEP